MRLFPRVSLKWKIFGGCFWLAILILVANYLNTNLLVAKSASSGVELQGVYRRYESFQKAMSQGMEAAVDLWASSQRLQETFTKGEDAQTRAMLEQVEKQLGRSLKPDFIVLVDKRGTVFATKGSPIDAADVPSMRLFGDLRQNMMVANTIVEHKKRAYLVAGNPVVSDNQVVGSILIGVHLERLFAEFKAESSDDPSKQIELALVHNGETTASAAHADDWDDIARAVRLEARETREEGGEKITIVKLPDGAHDFYAAQLNGYDAGASGSIGTLNFLRNRTSKEHHLEEIVHQNLLLFAIALAVAAIVSFGMSWVVTRPINQFIAATHDLAHGSGDLTKRIATNSGAKEMAELAENLNAMFASLHRLASEVQGASFQVGTSSAEISAASKQMLGGAKDQATRIESSTAAVTELSSSIQQVAENATQATKVARESGESLTEGVNKLVKTSDMIGEAAATIQQLGESGKRIGSIVEVIRQISEQTSLLALNASIEAAHAGEQGRGFAVVADEVSSLAKRVGQSAKDIEQLIASISEQTQLAVASMHNVTRAFNEHVTGANGLKVSLGQIIEVIQDTARSVQEQAVVSDEIARNMDAVQKIAQEVLGSSEEAVVQGEQLHALALRLEELVRNFQIDQESPRSLPDKPHAIALPEKSSERRKVARG